MELDGQNIAEEAERIADLLTRPSPLDNCVRKPGLFSNLLYQQTGSKTPVKALSADGRARSAFSVRHLSISPNVVLNFPLGSSLYRPKSRTRTKSLSQPKPKAPSPEPPVVSKFKRPADPEAVFERLNRLAQPHGRYKHFQNEVYRDKSTPGERHHREGRRASMSPERQALLPPLSRPVSALAIEVERSLSPASFLLMRKQSTVSPLARSVLSTPVQMPVVVEVHVQLEALLSEPASVPETPAADVVDETMGQAEPAAEQTIVSEHTVDDDDIIVLDRESLGFIPLPDPDPSDIPRRPSLFADIQLSPTSVARWLDEENAAQHERQRKLHELRRLFAYRKRVSVTSLPKPATDALPASDSASVNPIAPAMVSAPTVLVDVPASEGKSASRSAKGSTGMRTPSPQARSRVSSEVGPRSRVSSEVAAATDAVEAKLTPKRLASGKKEPRVARSMTTAPAPALVKPTAKKPARLHSSTVVASPLPVMPSVSTSTPVPTSTPTAIPTTEPETISPPLPSNDAESVEPFAGGDVTSTDHGAVMLQSVDAEPNARTTLAAVQPMEDVHAQTISAPAVLEESPTESNRADEVQQQPTATTPTLEAEVVPVVVEVQSISVTNTAVAENAVETTSATGEQSPSGLMHDVASESVVPTTAHPQQTVTIAEAPATVEPTESVQPTIPLDQRAATTSSDTAEPPVQFRPSTASMAVAPGVAALASDVRNQRSSSDYSQMQARQDQLKRLRALRQKQQAQEQQEQQQ